MDGGVWEEGGAGVCVSVCVGGGGEGEEGDYLKASRDLSYMF